MELDDKYRFTEPLHELHSDFTWAEHTASRQWFGAGRGQGEKSRSGNCLDADHCRFSSSGGGACVLKRRGTTHPRQTSPPLLKAEASSVAREEYVGFAAIAVVGLEAADVCIEADTRRRGRGLGYGTQSEISLCFKIRMVFHADAGRHLFCHRRAATVSKANEHRAGLPKVDSKPDWTDEQTVLDILPPPLFAAWQ
jgi:hypothetical protein